MATFLTEAKRQLALHGTPDDMADAVLRKYRDELQAEDAALFQVLGADPGAYTSGLFQVVWAGVRQTALAHIAEHAPRAWFRHCFAEQHILTE